MRLLYLGIGKYPPNPSLTFWRVLQDRCAVEHYDKKDTSLSPSLHTSTHEQTNRLIYMFDTSPPNSPAVLPKRERDGSTVQVPSRFVKCSTIK